MLVEMDHLRLVENWGERWGSTALALEIATPYIDFTLVCDYCSMKSTARKLGGHYLAVDEL